MIAARVANAIAAVVIAVIFLALGAVVVGSATQRFRLAPVLSGSMAPTIPKGALVMAEPIPSSAIRVGEVLLFTPPIPGHPLVMHRIHDMTRRGDVLAFHTKGDANAAPDAWTIRVKGPQAWRVVHAVPYVGSAIGWMSTGNVRFGVLVLGALILLGFGLRAVWALRPISWHADDPYGTRRRSARRRATSRAFATTSTGLLLVAALAVAGLASAQFTAAATPPTPGYGSGQLASPATMTCTWGSSATQLRLDWQNNSPTFTTGYDVRRSTTSGSGYSTIGTTGAATTVTYTDTPSPVTAVKYYVTTATHGTWTSADSNERASNGCIGAINLVAGTTTGFSGDNGQATAAQLAAPQGVAVDSSGNVYIADTTNNRIRKVTASTGIITTIAGGGASTACTFSGAATSVSLNAPRGVAVDSSGNVYIADTGNNCVRKVTGATVSQVAGGGASTACNYSGVATGVSMSSPRGVAVDTSGNVYIADFTRNCVRMVTGANITGVAGGGASTGCAFSGAATSATLAGPSSVAIDASGSLYIADTTNNCIRKVTGGAIGLFAGTGATTACSTAAGATTVSLSGPTGVAVDSLGRVVIVDSGRRCVRMVTSGNVSLLAGTGVSGSTGDNGPAIAALFTTPAGAAADSTGDVWVVDAGTHRVRRVEGPV